MSEKNVLETNKAVIERFFHEMWNTCDLAVADEIISPSIRFRGSLGTTLEGLQDFKGYVKTVRAAFPAWHNQIDELIAADDKVVARMTYSGTHQGRLFDVEPTGNRVTYAGVAIFRLSDGKIEDGWVVGDTQELWKALGRV